MIGTTEAVAALMVVTLAMVGPGKAVGSTMVAGPVVVTIGDSEAGSGRQCCGR